MIFVELLQLNIWIFQVFEFFYDELLPDYIEVCGETISGFGNNAEPVMDGYCCDKCNAEIVMPARLKNFLENRKKNRENQPN